MNGIKLNFAKRFFIDGIDVYCTGIADSGSMRRHACASCFVSPLPVKTREN